MTLPSDPYLAALRLNLVQLRHDRGWSFRALAERRRLSRQPVMDIEHGKTVGILATWHAFAHAFGRFPTTVLFDVQQPQTAARGNQTPRSATMTADCKRPFATDLRSSQDTRLLVGYHQFGLVKL